ncbi:MAG: Peptidyl-prolyl cis-trans isomerase NIMA-interacting protein 1 [Peltula sp. TS41687]|nr:MAG: Peptidyl-prolyl cis-trans isomerase NIMA-interacting protein 1 [Peltula sp. TS41687]
MDPTTGLPPGWEVRHSTSKKLPYFFHPTTKESRWEPPTPYDADVLKKYIAKHHPPFIRASHLLVKHKDSRRPSSWREVCVYIILPLPYAALRYATRRDARRAEETDSVPLVVGVGGQAEITRSKDEAIEMLNEHKKRIDAGEVKLGDLAATESDCSSYRKGGDLGSFGRGDMQKEFEDVAFALEVGQMSGVVETASGVHLIQRTE